MATTKYVLKNKKGQTELVITLKYYHNGNVQFSTGRKVQPKYWSELKQNVKPSHINSESINNYLLEFEANILDLVNATYANNIEPDANYIKKLYVERQQQEKSRVSVEKSKVTLFEFMQKYTEDSEALLATRTIQSYKTFYDLLKDYEKRQNKKIDFESIDLDFYYDFLKFMYEPPYSYSMNTAGSKIKILKKFLNEATERGLNENLIFRSRKFIKPTQETDKIYLTLNELERIYKHNFTDIPHLDRTRDRFIIGCFTGLRYGNFIKLKKENFIEIEGEKLISVRPEKGWKNSNTIIIPQHPYIKAIIEKYGGTDKLPKEISAQKFNDQLKIIGERSGIDETVILTESKGGKRQSVTYKKYEKIGTHTARRSFATNAYLEGVPAISIMKITGHKTESVFMKYICIDNQENALEMAKNAFFK